MSDDLTKSAILKSRSGSWFRRGLKYASIMALVVGTIVAASTTFTSIPGEETLSSGAKRNSAVFVPMKDSTKIAADIWLPTQMKAGEKMPVIMVTTRYWRAQATGWLARGLYGLGLGGADLAVNDRVAYMNKRGFIVLMIDARGTGASGGDRVGEWAPAEVKDLGEVASWAATQPWSNGSVGAMGVSYSGNTAELIASTGEPSIKAVAPLYNDFDPQLHNSNPGGVFNTGFITGWGNATGAMDRNDICALAETTGIMCIITKWMVPSVKPVDADTNGKRLAAILARRKSNNVLNALTGVEHRDDKFKDAGGLALADVSPFAMKDKFEKHQIPILVWSGWLDAATSDGTLSRYLTFNTPQEVHIGAFSHGGGHDTDPSAPTGTPSDPNEDVQNAAIADFFDKYLRGNTPPLPTRMIHYYTMGARVWKQTASWPPVGTNKQTLYFGDQSSLIAQPLTATTPDRYTVNFTASMGAATRWHTQMGGGDVIYPDRRKEDAKLLTYTSAPLKAATEITGTPIVSVFLSTTATDSVVIAYLEDVAPDGRVTYITEGILRLINRKETATGLPYVTLGVNRGFKRVDALPVVPGEVMQCACRSTQPPYRSRLATVFGSRFQAALMRCLTAHLK